MTKYFLSNYLRRNYLQLSKKNWYATEIQAKINCHAIMKGEINSYFSKNIYLSLTVVNDSNHSYEL